VALEVAAGDWNALLARLGADDVYLRREYVESACLIEAGSPAFLHTDDVVFACIVRDFAGRVDVTTPYGYGGPVAADPANADAFYAAYADWCAERDVVSTFVRFHPLYENHRYARMHVEPLGATIAWRLQGEDLFERLHAHHRRAIRKAQRAELAVDVEERPELDEFVELYRGTMARVDADSFYLFTPEYWGSLEQLPCLLVSARREGELAAAVLCFAAKPWLHYHLGASSDEGRALGASNLVLFEAARWAREGGYELLHLGGGIGGRRDSLFEFKRRFDPGGEREFAVGKAVHDEAGYRELAGDTSADAIGFFPAYRDTSRR
jgi:serine/alanine adding enzyme